MARVKAQSWSHPANDRWQSLTVETTPETLSAIWDGPQLRAMVARYLTKHDRAAGRRAVAREVVRDAEERTRDGALLVRLRRAAEDWIQEERDDETGAH